MHIMMLQCTSIIIYHNFVFQVSIVIIGCPTILRTDCGTESSIVAFLQPTLRHAGSDFYRGEKSFSMAVLQLIKYVRWDNHDKA